MAQGKDLFARPTLSPLMEMMESVLAIFCAKSMASLIVGLFPMKSLKVTTLGCGNGLGEHLDLLHVFPNFHRPDDAVRRIGYGPAGGEVLKPALFR